MGTVNRLLAHDRVDPSARNNEAIRVAARYGHLAVVNRLLAHDRVDPTADDNVAIRLAARYGHLAVVDRLLAHDGVDPTAVDNAAIRSAALNGHLAVVNRLLEDPRVDPSARDNFAIIWAARMRHLDVVSSLIGNRRVARTVKYSDLGSLSDEDMIKSIVQSIFMKINIPRKDLNLKKIDSQFFRGCNERIFDDPLLKSALKSQDMRQVFDAISHAWKKIVYSIQYWQVRYLWNPEGPRAKKQFERWRLEDE